MKDEFMRKTAVVWLTAFLCCLLWGSAFPCIKIGYGQLHIAADDSMSQILYAGCRFLLAGLLVILFGSLLQKKLLLPSRQSFPKIIHLSLYQTIGQYVLFYIGLAHASGVKSSIIEGSSAFVAILAASLLFHQEKLTLRKAAGCLLGFAGVLLVNLNGTGWNMDIRLLGEGFVFLSTVAYAFSSAYLKRYSGLENGFVLSGYQFLFGGAVMCAAGVLFGGNLHGFTIQSFGLLVYMALISAVAYTLWGFLLKYNPVSRIAVFGFMTPVIGVILSALLLGEGAQAAGANSVIALVLVCIGICIVNREKQPS